MRVTPIYLSAPSTEPINYHTCKNSRRPSPSKAVSGARLTGNSHSTIYRYRYVESCNTRSTVTSRSTPSVDSTGRDTGITPRVISFKKTVGFLCSPNNRQCAFTYYKGERDNHFNNTLTYIQEYCPFARVRNTKYIKRKRPARTPISLCTHTDRSEPSPRPTLFEHEPRHEKTCPRVWDQARLQMAFSASETKQSPKTLEIGSIGIIPSKQRTTKALIRLCGWASVARIWHKQAPTTWPIYIYILHISLYIYIYI